MELWKFLLLGLAWVVTCLLLGLYVIGIGVSSQKQFTIGFRAMFFSYLIGVGLLLYAIMIV